MSNEKVTENTGRITKRCNPFTMTSNKMITDRNLSTRAKGLYVLINYYVNIPNFTLYRSYLASIVPEGEKAFRSMWNELKDAGYLKVTRTNTSHGFVYEYELLDEPISPKGTDGEGTCGESTSGQSNSGEGTAINKKKQNKTVKNKTIDNNPSIEDIKMDIDRNENKYAFNDYYKYASLQVNSENVKKFITFSEKRDNVMDEWLTAIAEIYSSCDEFTFIGKRKYKTINIKQRVNKLNEYTFAGLIMNFNDQEGQIKNPAAYIKTLLINGASSNGLSQSYAQSFEY